MATANTNDERLASVIRRVDHLDDAIKHQQRALKALASLADDLQDVARAQQELIAMHERTLTMLARIILRVHGMPLDREDES
jgi:hypothetical protein